MLVEYKNYGFKPESKALETVKDVAWWLVGLVTKKHLVHKYHLYGMTDPEGIFFEGKTFKEVHDNLIRKSVVTEKPNQVVLDALEPTTLVKRVFSTKK